MADGFATQPLIAFNKAQTEVIAPGNDMRSGYNAKFVWPANTGKIHEVTDGAPIGALGMRITEVSKPLDLRRHFREFEEFGGRKEPLSAGDRNG